MYCITLYHPLHNIIISLVLPATYKATHAYYASKVKSVVSQPSQLTGRLQLTHSNILKVASMCVIIHLAYSYTSTTNHAGKCIRSTIDHT